MKFPKEIIIRFEVDAKGTTVTAMGGGELIRCKDCKYNLNGLCDQISLEWHPFRVEDDEFCAWAERKDED